jgi:hypothetical protein
MRTVSMPVRIFGREKRERLAAANLPEAFVLIIIPCSCGASFAVAEDYERRGM